MKKKEAINDLLEDILEIYNRPVNKKGGVITTEKKRPNYPIILKEKTIDYKNLDNLVERFGGRFLVISLDGFTRGAIELAKEVGIDLWDQKKLEREIGKAVLSEVGIENKIDLNRPENLELLERNLENNDYENSDLLAEKKSPDTIEPSKDKTKREPKKEKFFTLNIDKKNALDESSIRNPSIHILTLKPYYEIQYSCNSEFEHKKNKYKIQENGACYLNAINGEIKDFEVQTKSNNLNSNNISIDKREKKIQKEEATKKAKKKLKEKLAIEKNWGKNKRESIVFETKKIKPSKEDIKIDNKGIVYRPIWDIRNSQRSTKIDGVDGNVVPGNTEEGAEFL
ncbi:hypothetical protein C9439_06005 [archaeon SCG-AAA382B04]|nr:hypothetical protein C9439_06005 [archaeon SCG-AAA382B04]